MDRNAVIIITGAAGFIGSCLTGYLNRKGYYNIIIVDDFSDENKRHNYEEKKICARVDKDELFDWLDRYKIRIDFIFHFGAYTGDPKSEPVDFGKLNLEYSKQVWSYCADKNIPMVYASSGATYGTEEEGFNDFIPPEKLKPVSPYGTSKNEFDTWVLQQSNEFKQCPSFWAGLKFFDVYGPNEYHKGKSASHVFRLFQEVYSAGSIKLDKSNQEENKDSRQKRDFVYVKDVVDICYWLMQQGADEVKQNVSGLYNVCTGNPRSFDEIAKAVCKSLNKEIEIEYTEPHISSEAGNDYIYQPGIKRIQEAGYPKKFYSLEDGVKTYVQQFLLDHRYY